jgi:hypothetical protein
METGVSYIGGATIPNPLTFGLQESEKFLPFGGQPGTDKYGKTTR